MLRWVVEQGGKPLLLVLTIGMSTLGYVAFWGSPRFHFPLTPLFCLLAGWGACGVWQRLPRKNR